MCPTPQFASASVVPSSGAAVRSVSSGKAPVLTSCPAGNNATNAAISAALSELPRTSKARGRCKSPMFAPEVCVGSPLNTPAGNDVSRLPRRSSVAKL